MAAARDVLELPTAVLKTWGPRGLVRRAAYEAMKRTGRLRSVESSSLAVAPMAIEVRSAGTVPLRRDPSTPTRREREVAVRLYGALDPDVPVPPKWHHHPITGHALPADVHWSELSDASPRAGDVKDIWEMSRLGWLLPMLRDASGDERTAERIWSVIEDWTAANPPYRGPNWMCGQETSLRAITVLFLADALRASPATTGERRAMVAELAQRSVVRVAPSLGYALSQRNNHAVSEAGFLWTAALLLPSLPDAGSIRRRAARALTEAADDQFAPDGSYAQHSPTYQRLALHVLLWCLLVARTTGEAAPRGVKDAVGRSVPFLRALVAPGSEGRVPNLGGNDGALLFDLTAAEIGDLRPVIAHAAAVTGQPSGFGTGPWDDEARWFGLAPVDRVPAAATVPSTTTHALTCGTTHAVVRAGPLAHRPAHADQLHTDVWLGGMPVAVDPGSYRYTAPAPWANALSGDDVHNLPRRPGTPQAVRAGRFFWRRWAEAEVENVLRTDHGSGLAARLQLPDGTLLRRFVAVGSGLVIVVDEADTDDVVTRWNLLGAPSLELQELSTSVAGVGWSAGFHHGPGATVPTPTRDDPPSGWHSPTYGVLDPLKALMLPVSPGGRVMSCFASRDRSADVGRVLQLASTLDLSSIDDRALNDLVRST